eukprot:CAMPEP_0119293184 /NCGR_PEP_ID=MMETSP1329-20130426/45593_1 /TAXON_ID=114041 /ORGANISM="Genus nov. species nov., Strain RCC1024" /LENGTH=93 /DNA_ID=CAMNT_0007294047 /DNA_START=145 /DNA_END=423 /DNA_ORIENTATION=-
MDLVTHLKKPAVAWSIIVALAAVSCSREVQRARVCELSAADVARGEALVAAEVAKLWGAAAAAESSSDDMLAALAAELAEVEAASSSLVARGR